MSGTRFKLSTTEVLEFALEGIRTTIGVNSGNPDWTREDWEYHYKAEREIERRLKIARVQESMKAAQA